jgi:valyl-tRNA synthetase
LDEGPSKAVRTTFVNLYKKGQIYRGERGIMQVAIQQAQ